METPSRFRKGASAVFFSLQFGFEAITIREDYSHLAFVIDSDLCDQLSNDLVVEFFDIDICPINCCEKVFKA